MIHTDHIIPGSRAAQTLDPPAVVVFLVQIPPVQGVAPKLTVLIKAIGRAACHVRRCQSFVQQEPLGIAPNVRGIIGHVDGHVTDNGNAVFMGIGPQLLPLAVEQILHKGIEPNLLFQFLTGLPNGCRLPALEGFLPFIPGLAVFLGLQRHEQCKIRQPVAVLPGKGFQSRIFREPAIGQPQHVQPMGIQKAKVCPVGVRAPVAAGDLLRPEKTLLHQHIQVNEIMVACVG